MKINSLYVSVFDMDRAIRFYADHIFKKPPKNQSQRFSVFDIGGFQFCLFNPEVVKETHVVGNNCIPTIEVENVRALYEEMKQKEAKIILELHNVEDYHLFQLKDSEDNILEFYQITVED